jgi:hypothetical protein
MYLGSNLSLPSNAVYPAILVSTVPAAVFVPGPVVVLQQSGFAVPVRRAEFVSVHSCPQQHNQQYNQQHNQQHNQQYNQQYNQQHNQQQFSAPSHNFSSQIDDSMVGLSPINISKLF